MSILADKTEKKAIRILTRCVKILDDLDRLQITKLDDFDISLAKNLMKKVIESNDQPIELTS
jgi:hypothetical protein